MRGGWERDLVGSGNEISHVVSDGWYGYMNSVNLLAPELFFF